MLTAGVCGTPLVSPRCFPLLRLALHPGEKKKALSHTFDCLPIADFRLVSRIDTMALSGPFRTSPF